ncbi:MAG: hypothetical protein GVY10_12210 [Verrucomicrobia bacterium]|jgi:hypothetical protein|nr:hypothetical protein [Verrucomicrobiota bacterium]
MEGRPLRKALFLRGKPGFPFPVFLGESHVLVQSGTGSAASAAATAWALATFPTITNALNIGFAGALPPEFPLHSWVRAHSVRDQASGRLYLPDILDAHPFAEGPLLTVGRVQREPVFPEGLVDMEGSGFALAARRFLPAHRITLLKWISDAQEGGVDGDGLETAFAASLPDILPFLQPDEGEGNSPSVADEAAESFSNEVEAGLRLTVTQRGYLRRWLRGYLARGGDAEAVRQVLPAAIPATKSGNNKVFEEVRRVLAR